MTIVQMLYFDTVCQYMSLTKAAQSLHISQPALSSVIKQIENECGVMLFEHRANSIHITDEGLVVREEIQPILQQFQRLDNLIVGHKLDRNYIRIGLSSIRANGIMSQLAAAFRQKYPDVQLLLTEGATMQHYENLDMNKLDLIITSRRPDLTDEEFLASREYAAIPLRSVQLLFAVSADHPLAQREEVNWADIASEHLIFLDKPFGIAKYVEKDLKEAGFEIPSNAYYTSQIYTAVKFIEENAACGFLPQDAIENNERLKGLCYPRSHPHMIYLIYRKDRHLFRAAKLFVQTAKELFRQDH